MAYRRTEAVLARLAGRRADILAAAAEIAERDGLDQVDVRSVAPRAGVAMGTLYLHFPNMTELRAAVVARRLERDLGAMRRAEPNDSAAGFAAALAVYIHRIRRSPVMARSLAAEPGYWVTMTRALQDAVAAAVKRGEIAPCDTRIAATAVYGALTTAVLHDAVGQPGQKNEQALVSVALRAVGYGGDRAKVAAAAGVKAAQ